MDNNKQSFPNIGRRRIVTPVLTSVLLLFSIVSTTLDVPVFADTTASLHIRAIDIVSESEISGLWVSVYTSENTLVSSGFTPHYYNLTSSGTYRIGFSNYGSFYFTTTNSTSNYHVVDWGGTVEVELDHTQSQIVDGFYFDEENPGSYVRMTFLDEDTESEEIGGMSVALKDASGNITLTKGFTPYSVGAPGDVDLKVVWNNYGPYFYIESTLSPQPPGDEWIDTIESWGGVQGIHLPITSPITSYTGIAIYGSEIEMLVAKHSQLLEELDQIGQILEEETITQELIDDINSKLTNLQNVAIGLQNAGFDGYISAERVSGQVIGTVKFNSTGSSQPLIETQISNGTMGIFMAMATERGFSEYDLPLNSTQTATLLKGSSVFTDVVTMAEDDDIAFDLVLASIASFYPSTGNSTYVVPLGGGANSACETFGLSAGGAVARNTSGVFNTGGLAEALANVAETVWIIVTDDLYQRVVVNGTKFHDFNGNGTRDDPIAEPGLANFTFSIHTTRGAFQCENFVQDLIFDIGPITAVSNGTGFFEFNNVRVPKFVEKVVIVEEEVAGWEITVPAGGLEEREFTPQEPEFFPYKPGVARLEPVEFGNRALAYSLVFDGGGSSLMQVTNHTDYQNLSAFTVSFWIKQFSDDAAGTYASKGTGWSLEQASTRKVIIKYTTVNDDFTPNNVIVPGTWQHIVASIDPNASDGNWRKIYVDGQRVDELTSGGSIPAIPNSGNLQFGAGSHVKMWDIRFYDVELSSSDVTNLYQGQNVTGGLVSHWQLIEGSGTSVQDSAGGHTGELTGTVTWDTDIP